LLRCCFCCCCVVAALEHFFLLVSSNRPQSKWPAFALVFERKKMGGWVILFV
jgi:hypothetical protein